MQKTTAAIIVLALAGCQGGRLVQGKKKKDPPPASTSDQDESANVEESEKLDPVEEKSTTSGEAPVRVIPESVVPLPSTAPPKAPCADGDENADWADGNSHCYMYFESKADFATARTKCLKIDAYLVTLTTREEAQFINDTFGTSAFIGLSDVLTEGSFLYFNGPENEIMGGKPFINFEPGEPNNVGNEDCVIITDTGKWDDRQCQNAHPFICER